MECTLDKEDLEELNRFIESGKLTQFLANNLCSFSNVAFILQTILMAKDEVEKKLKEEE